MADNTLDRLDADPGGARQYLAALYTYGATHEQAAQKLAEKFGIRQPSKRITGEWRRNDAKLRQMIERLEAVKRDMSPDAAPADVLANVPAPVDPARVATDLWTLLDEHPAFATLFHRVELDPDFDDDDAPRRVLLETESGEELEAASAALVGDWDVHIALGADPADVARVARARTEGTLEEAYTAHQKRRRAEAA